MTSTQQQEVVDQRKLLKVPWHAPPHFGTGTNVYLITASCYEHTDVLISDGRRDEWQDIIINRLSLIPGVEIKAWVVLPNHYHVLVKTDLALVRKAIGRWHNVKSTQWNREDGKAGRQVWYKFSDRKINGERHHYATLNYIHANPVKHGYVGKANEWRWSSFSKYLEKVGRETLRSWWTCYPVENYGKGWDD